MATLTYQIPRRRGTWQVQFFPEAATQSFAVGDILAINTSGQVHIASASGSDYDTDGDDFIGIAGEAASGTTNNYVKVYCPVDSNSQFQLPVEHGTPASAVTAEAQVGDTLALSHEGGVWAAAIDNTTKPIVKVMDISSDYPIGEQYGLVWVAALANARFAV